MSEGQGEKDEKPGEEISTTFSAMNYIRITFSGIF